MCALLATACIGRSARQAPPATATSSELATTPEIELLSTTLAECVPRKDETGWSQPGHALLAIDPTVAPYKPNINPRSVTHGTGVTAIFCLCVDELGAIADVKIIARTTPEIDTRIAKAMWRWRYQPYVVDGEPTPFCYPVNYTIR